MRYAVTFTKEKDRFCHLLTMRFISPSVHFYIQKACFPEKRLQKKIKTLQHMNKGRPILKNNFHNRQAEGFLERPFLPYALCL